MSFHLRMTPEQLEAYTARTKTHVKLESRKPEAHIANPSTELPQVRSCKPTPPKNRKKTVYAPVPTEHDEQSAVIEWFDLYAPTVGLDPRLLFSVPNGSSKSIPQAMKFKREGLRAGVPDLMLAISALCKATQDELIGRQVFVYGLFIEMKRRHGSQLREDQAEMIALLTAQGYRCVVAKGADEAIAAIVEYLG